ncbi:MAG: hypothetical protein UD103_07765 [Bacteroidales bacterium]|nr:hypothetical protein [Bacteroidales bacterium]
MRRKKVSSYFTGYRIDGLPYVFDTLKEAKDYIELEMSHKDRLKKIKKGIYHFNRGISDSIIPITMTERKYKFGKVIKLNWFNK